MVLILVLIVLILLLVVVLYNSLIQLKNRVKEGWAQIDVQLKRRADLIPNLIETVKGYKNYEKSVLEEVTKARANLQNSFSDSKLPNSENIDKINNANNSLTSALGRLFAVAENYPDLKASNNFMNLQEELSNTENKVSFARQYYNDAVRELNTKIEVFPSNIIAKMFNIKEATYFEVVNEQDKEVPKVKFE